jgi:hypothetical protein
LESWNNDPSTSMPVTWSGDSYHSLWCSHPTSRPRSDQGASKIGLDKLWSKSMHLPWNQYHVGPAKIVHGSNGGNSVNADSGGK